ncbi:MAG: hypothetical protein WBC70_13290, partial [Candidatus Aminicenantales bacterium]
MSVLFHLFKKRLPGAIARDLNKKYMAVKRRHPGENDAKLLERVWNLYITLNEEAIRAEDGEDKIIRLDIIKERIEQAGQPGHEVDGLLKPKNLMDLF